MKLASHLERLLPRIRIEVKKISRVPFLYFLNPFETTEFRPVIVHCCYHKTGTVWFQRILRDISAHFGLKFRAGEPIHFTKSTEVFLDWHSRLDLSLLPDYRASHIIRDPRDIIVSRYHYHL